MVFVQLTYQLYSLNLIKPCNIFFKFLRFLPTTNQFSVSAICDITFMPVSVTIDKPKPVRLLTSTENVSLTKFQSPFIGLSHGSVLRSLATNAVDILCL